MKGSGSGLVRVRRVGSGAGRTVRVVAALFGGIGALRWLLEPDGSWADLVALGLALLLWLWSFRPGIWVGDGRIVVRSYWRTLSLRIEDAEFRSVPYESYLTWGFESTFLSMLVLIRGERRYTLQFTVAWREACRQDAWFLTNWPQTVVPVVRRHA